MLDKTHLISGGVTFVSLVATCVLLFTTRSNSPETTQTPATELYSLPTPPLLANTPPAPTPSPNSTIATDAKPITPTFPMFLRSAEAERDCIYLEFSTTEKINLTLNQNLFVTPAIKNLNILPRWDAYGVRLQGDLKPETE